MASIMKRGNAYSVRYTYTDHHGKPCQGWESFKTKKEAQERKITVEKELQDGTFLIPPPPWPNCWKNGFRSNPASTNGRLKPIPIPLL